MENKLPENMTMINEDDLNNVSGGTGNTLSIGIKPTFPVLNSFNMTPVTAEELAQEESGYHYHDTTASPKARGI